jgi:heparan-sulfate lyase
MAERNADERPPAFAEKESPEKRREIFSRLRSFDPRGLAPGDVEARTLDLLSGGFADAEAVHRHFAGREPPPDALPAPGPDLRTADDCLRNVFDFYGETHDVGADIDWERNPGTDHWGHDLNRFSYLAALVRAAGSSGDDKYLRKGAELILDWVRKNEATGSWYWYPDRERREVSPYVWSSYLNIALHLVNWTRFLDSWVRFWSPSELLEVLKSIHDQLAYLELVIPTTDNNWVVIGCWGITMSATRLRELRDSRRFLDYALAGLSREADRQVLPDGVQFELTPHYHFGVARWLCDCMSACRDAGLAAPGNLEAVTARMLDYCMQTVTPDDRQVSFNDSDPNCAAGVRGLLEKEGRRRARPDWLQAGTLGAEGGVPGVLSQAFEHGGVYVMRTGWSAQSTYLAFDGGPAGHSHRHFDRLGFWLSSHGRSFLVDPGRYLYDSHNPYSPYLRSTRAHSTITVDGEDQADSWFRETWDPGPRIDGNTWIVTDEWQRVAGSHELGYGEAGSVRVTHRRSITFWPPDVFLVLDRLDEEDEGGDEGAHEIRSRLQFFPGDLVREGRVWRTTYDDANIAVLPFMEAAFDVVVEKGLLDPVSGWYSERVNRIEPSPTLVVRATAPVPVRGAFLLVPYGGRTAPELSLSLEGDRVTLGVAGKERALGFDEAMR